MSQPAPNTDDRRSSAVGAALYYGITALVVVAIIITVIGGKFFYRRKHIKEMRRRNDLERQNAARRGEATGLPTYLEHGSSVPVSMPTLAYPDAAYRRDHGSSAAPGEADFASRADPSLPSYEAAGPPKYEYATGNNNNAPAAAGVGGVVARAAEGIRQALSRPGSIRRANSSSTQPGLPTTANINSHNNANGGSVEMQQTHHAASPRIMTSAPAMYANPSASATRESVAAVSQSHSGDMARTPSMRSARSTQSARTPLPEDGQMHVVSLNDNEADGHTDQYSRS